MTGYREIMAVQDRSVLTLVDVRAEIAGLDAIDDARLQCWLDEAKQAADNYVNNPFEDSQGQPRAIPIEVEHGVVEYVRGLFGLASSGPQAGVVSESVGSWSKTFSDSASRGSLVMDIAREYWSRYRFEPGF